MIKELEIQESEGLIYRIGYAVNGVPVIEVSHTIMAKETKDLKTFNTTYEIWGKYYVFNQSQCERTKREWFRLSRKGRGF